MTDYSCAASAVLAARSKEGVGDSEMPLATRTEERRDARPVQSGSDTASGGPSTSNAFVSTAIRANASAPRSSTGNCA